MLAHRPTLPDAFDAAGSVFLPPDPAAADDDDDSFASQDTLIEDARTRHKRLARQRIHEAAGKEGAPRPLPVKQPVVAITPKRVQPPTPSDLAADDVPGLATADVRKELEARGLRAAGPRSIAVARLRHALEPQQKPQATHRGTGTGLFALENFAISPDADRVAFGAPVKLQVSDDEHGAVEYTLRCSKVVGGMHQLYAAWQAPSLTKGQTYEHVFEDVGTFSVGDARYDLECVVEVYAVTGMKELRERADRAREDRRRSQAMSRGAAFGVFADRNPAHLKIARDNAAAMGLWRECLMLGLDCSNLAVPPRAVKQPANLVFMDPPYGHGLADPTLRGLLNKNWLAPGAIVVVEISAEENLRGTRGFTLLDERSYGAAKVYFLKKSE